jgi:hypothetical protein
MEACAVTKVAHDPRTALQHTRAPTEILTSGPVATWRPILPAHRVWERPGEPRMCPNESIFRRDETGGFHPRERLACPQRGHFLDAHLNNLRTAAETRPSDPPMNYRAHFDNHLTQPMSCALRACPWFRKRRLQAANRRIGLSSNLGAYRMLRESQYSVLRIAGSWKGGKTGTYEVGPASMRAAA